MAEEDRRWGSIFQAETVVQVAEGVPLFQGPRQVEPCWLDFITPAPGQV